MEEVDLTLSDRVVVFSAAPAVLGFAGDSLVVRF